MTTSNKLERPKIYTESDQILNDLSVELSELKSRLGLLEDEQEQNKDLFNELAFQRDFSNELIQGQKKEITQNKENFSVIADVIHDLKSPVSDVVDNLADIISEIDDQETKDTLKECMDTASTVWETFNEVEEFCIDAGSSIKFEKKVTEIREFFKDIISQVQKNSAFEGAHTLKLLIEKNVPQKTQLSCSVIQNCLNSLLSEMRQATDVAEFTVIVSTENSEKKYGIELSDLSIQIKSSILTGIKWDNSWVKSIKENRDLLLKSGFNLLNTRDTLRKAGGEIEISTTDNQVSGFLLKLPLTY